MKISFNFLYGFFVLVNEMKCTDRQYSFIPLEEYEKEAIDFLRTNEPPEGYYVGFSGGKDSIVTLKLCQMASVVKFIRKNYPYVIWLKPKIDFWHGILIHGIPLRRRRWCCDELKKNATKDIPLKMRVMGIRAEESVKRAERPRIDYFKKYKQTLIKPIFNWKEWQVWEFIEKHNLPYPSLYDEGQSRIGCIICPFMFGEGKKAQMILETQKQKYKKTFAKFEKYCFEWWQSVKWKDEKYQNQTFEEFMDLYYKGFPKQTDNNQLTNFEF